MILALLAFLFGPPVTSWQSLRDFRMANPPLLSGTFDSCPDNEDGSYGERSFQRKDKRGNVQWEIHLGPRTETAVFDHEMPDDHVHSGKDNLLTAYVYEDVEVLAGGRNWTPRGLNIHINVVRVPGSYESCYSSVVLVEAGPRPTHAKVGK